MVQIDVLTRLARRDRQGLAPQFQHPETELVEVRFQYDPFGSFDAPLYRSKARI